MNLRIDGQELRFRISKQELENLCAGTRLKQTTSLPNRNVLEISIKTDTNSSMFLSYKDNQMILSVGNKLAVSLYDSLPNREGIETMQDDLRLILEVDIKTQKRKRDAS